MKDLRRRFERFCLKNRDTGIPNLMLVIAIGNLAVYALSYIDPSNIVYSYLCFSRSAILRGQVWRLFSYIFTYLNYRRGAVLLFSAFSLFFYYLTGLVLTDLAAMLLGAGADASALNLSLFLAVATIAPEAKVLLFFFIPIKMKYMAWVYLGFTVLNVFSSLQLASFLSFYWLLPVVPLLNYFLFFGSDVKNILPDALRYRQRKNYRTTTTNARPNPNWAGSYRSKSGEKPYRHKCTVCGRTDTDYPNLEFRYCSKCNGYYCYCIDHINNHVHITTPPEGAEKK